MALTLTRDKSAGTLTLQKEEEEEKLTGLDRLNALGGNDKTEPDEPEEKLSGLARLDAVQAPKAAGDDQAAETQAAASATYREVDNAAGRIRTRPQTLTTPSRQD